MNERAFFARGFVVRCPVWLAVDLKRFRKAEGCGSVALFTGRPSLGLFLPIFLNYRVADELARDANQKGYGVVEIKSAKELHKAVSLVTSLAELNNVAVYFKKGKVRFYRVEDLLEELESPIRN